MFVRNGKFVASVAFDTADEALDFEMYVAEGLVPESALRGAEVALLRAAEVAPDSMLSVNVATNVTGSLTQIARVEGKFTP